MKRSNFLTHSIAITDVLREYMIKVGYECMPDTNRSEVMWALEDLSDTLHEARACQTEAEAKEQGGQS